MRISIRRARNARIAPALPEYILRRVILATDRFAARLREVRVYLADLNGPRGGLDKLCQVTAVFRNGEAVAVRRNAGTYTGGVDLAVDLLRYRIAERLKRRRRTPIVRFMRRAGDAAVSPRRP